MRPYAHAIRTRYDAKVSNVTYHIGKRCFGTGYEMMEKILELEADLASIEEYGTEEINEAVDLRQRLAAALLKIDTLEDIIEELTDKVKLAVGAIKGMRDGSDASALITARDALEKLESGTMICPSCREPITCVSGDGCAAMMLHTPNP